MDDESQEKLREAAKRVSNLRYLRNVCVITAYEERQQIDKIRAEFGLGPLEPPSLSQ